MLSEIVGTKYPNEIVVLGGHIDSWDVGQGAHDGGACIVAWEVLRILNKLNLKPKGLLVCYVDE